jgi:hypothetical protein
MEAPAVVRGFFIEKIFYGTLMTLTSTKSENGRKYELPRMPGARRQKSANEHIPTPAMRPFSQKMKIFYLEDEPTFSRKQEYFLH